MSVLFHPHLDPAFIDDVLGQGAVFDRSAVQVLTKHGPEGGHDAPPLPPHVMLGVTLEHPRRLDRLDLLRAQPATTRFVSFEPWLAPMGPLDLSGIDWAIISGETKQDGEYCAMDPA